MADDRYAGEAPGKVKCPCTLSSGEGKVPLHSNRLTGRPCNAEQRSQQTRDLEWEVQILGDPIITQHGIVFWAIAVIIQVAIDEGAKLFSVEYNDV